MQALILFGNGDEFDQFWTWVSQNSTVMSETSSGVFACMYSPLMRYNPICVHVHICERAPSQISRRLHNCCLCVWRSKHPYCWTSVFNKLKWDSEIPKYRACHTALQRMQPPLNVFIGSKVKFQNIFKHEICDFVEEKKANWFGASVEWGPIRTNLINLKSRFFAVTQR